MHCLKHCFRFLCVWGVCMGASVWGSSQILSACLEEGKNLYAQQKLAQATATFEKCVQLAPQDVDAQLSLAGVLLTQEKLDKAEQHFQAALTHMKRTSPYLSYTYSMLGDIALKRKQHKQALEMYTKSLEYNAAYVNSLIGKALVLETQGNKQGAAEAYRSALAVEPLNIIARQRLIRLEPDYLSDEEILIALKQRYAVRPEEKELSEANRDLFFKIHQAEQRRGVEYLRNKYAKNTQDYIVTLNKNTDFARDILTLKGFEVLEKDIGQDAVAVFRQQKVPMQQIFDLRDKKGQLIFTKQSTLTESGFHVYTQALAGKKEYLLPGEPVPLSQAEIQKANQRAEILVQKGYAEISRSELKMLETETKCSEETLRKQLGIYCLPVAKKQCRYFVRTQDKQALKTVPYYYVMVARKKRRPQLEVPKNELIEYYNYYNYTICLSDGNLTLPPEE